MNINDIQGGGAERIPERPSRIKPPHFAADQVLSGPAGETVNVRLTEHTRDPEVLQLVQKLSRSPDVRPERIEDVRQQLAAGTFLTRQNAEATAEAFLR